MKRINNSDIIKLKSTTTIGIPNSITQMNTQKGDITRNYYNKKGFWQKQITNNDCGNKKKHTYGNNGEYAHDIILDNGKIVSRKPRELADNERKENENIL